MLRADPRRGKLGAQTKTQAENPPAWPALSRTALILRNTPLPPGTVLQTCPCSQQHPKTRREWGQ